MSYRTSFYASWYWIGTNIKDPVCEKPLIYRGFCNLRTKSSTKISEIGNYHLLTISYALFDPAHNPKVIGSNPIPATKRRILCDAIEKPSPLGRLFFWVGLKRLLWTSNA